MAAISSSDGSEDVTDFLRRIKELGDQKDHEDAERNKKLEDDILEGRKQREARRAERARSLSPEKSSPSTTPRAVRSPKNTSRSEFASSPLNPSSTSTFPPTIGSVIEEPERNVLPSSPPVEDVPPPLPPMKPAPETVGGLQNPVGSKDVSPSLPDRSGTLSWQQRPVPLRASKGVDANLQPTPSPPTHNTISEAKETEILSRDRVTASLASKDASWFRQTEDRGKGSPAYRRNIQDTESYTPPTEKKALHGLSREAGRHDRDRSEPSEVDSLSTTLYTPTESKFTDSQTMSSKHTSPWDGDVSQALEIKPPLPERPSSPTKGSGGFVQSAMLKRSDSINKRWSAQATPHLIGQTPNISGRGPAFSSSISTPRLGDSKAEITAEESSRPGSSHSNTTPRHGFDSFVKPAMPQHSRSQSSMDGKGGQPGTPTNDLRPPSPSKRWSPQKASWLESALNRPESPTTKSPGVKSGPPQQPAWMTELSRAKQQRASRDIQLDWQTPRTAESEHPSILDQALKGNPIASNSVKSNPPSTKPKPVELTKTPVQDPYVAPEDLKSAAPIKHKAKPITPPKKDFRSQLRVTKPPPEKGSSDEPEFLNAFGKLKRAQTEKYVAPDELKENILRGKSSLATSDGPQKTPVRDEVKESLIKQREAIKTRSKDTPASLPQSPVVTAEIPEAIAKKQALGRNDSFVNAAVSPNSDGRSFQNHSEAGSKKALTPSIASIPLLPTTAPNTSQETESNSSNVRNFNTNLANILARGPQTGSEGKSPSAPSPSGNHNAVASQRSLAAENEVDSQTGQLQHMTKARARGPKRRLPKVNSSSAAETPKNSSPRDVERRTTHVSPPPLPPSKSRNITPLSAKSAASNALPAKPPISPKPQPPSKSPQLQNSPRSISRDISVIGDLSKPQPTTSPMKDATIGSTEPLGLKENSRPLGTQKTELRPEENAALKSLNEISTNLIGPSTKFLSAKPAVASPRAGQQQTTLLPSAGNKNFVSVAKDLSGSKPESPTPRQVPTKPPAPPSGSQNLLVDYFGEIPVAPSKLDVDVKGILSSNQQMSESKTRTVKNEISELGSDGKTTAVSSNQEHVLFSDRIYVCTHIFEDAAGLRKSEVYLWAGSSVAEAAVEDAQLFARRTAKNAGAKLSVIHQGQEPPHFFQALGGIAVIRNGTSRDESSRYMLCGRKHQGHLTFDEVPLAASNLCSGFPYIIVSGLNNVFLWRGSGCNTEELSGARLISMDMGSEVTEVEEGKEPRELLALFAHSNSASGIPRSADHWKLKAKYDNYCVRLFRVEYSERPISRQNSGPAAVWNFVRPRSRAGSDAVLGTKVKEVEPFSQSDLHSESVFVLDAFFEIYIILGSAARLKQNAFASAVQFVQEYAALAASHDNRPYAPPATIVLEGAPRDMKRVFRRWDDSLMPTVNAGDGLGIKRGPSLKIMPMSHALGVMKSNGKE